MSQEKTRCLISRGSSRGLIHRVDPARPAPACLVPVLPSLLKLRMARWWMEEDLVAASSAVVRNHWAISAFCFALLHLSNCKVKGYKHSPLRFLPSPIRDHWSKVASR